MCPADVVLEAKAKVLKAHRVLLICHLQVVYVYDAAQVLSRFLNFGGCFCKVWAFVWFFLNLQTLIQDLYPQSAAVLSMLCCLTTSINLTYCCEESYCCKMDFLRSAFKVFFLCISSVLMR